LQSAETRDEIRNVNTESETQPRKKKIPGGRKGQKDRKREREKERK